MTPAMPGRSFIYSKIAVEMNINRTPQIALSTLPVGTSSEATRGPAACSPSERICSKSTGPEFIFSLTVYLEKCQCPIPTSCAVHTNNK